MSKQTDTKPQPQQQQTQGTSVPIIGYAAGPGGAVPYYKTQQQG